MGESLDWSCLPFPRLGDTAWQKEAVLWLASRHDRTCPSPLFCIVRSHPFAADYLRQAPVLCACSDRRLIKAIELGGKLKTVMKAAGVAYPLRILALDAVASLDAELVSAISRFHPSLLAQALPIEPCRHKEWITQIRAWSSRMATSLNRDPDFLLEWAVVHALDAILQAQPLHDIVDFAANGDATFNGSWTFDRAARATRDWHAELAKVGAAAKQSAKLGIRFDQAVDYGDLPVSTTIDGFEIVALRSGQDLHEDGRRMRHCVVTYLADVLAGKSRIFSIRRGETPLATMELRFAVRSNPSKGHTARSWYLGQIKGSCNFAPDWRVAEIASEFVASLNQKKAA